MKNIPYKIYHYKSLTSTQDKAKEFAKKGLSNIIISADTQSKGRGRFKRRWHSDKEGLWISILLKPKYTGNLQHLTFATTVAIVKSIKKITGLNASIKWPNDVHYKGKKLCGILTEGIFGKENYVVIGIGVNANQKKFSGEIKDTATSIRIVKNKKIDAKKLLRTVIQEFFAIYNGFYKKNKLEKIRHLWEKHCDTINKEIIAVTKIKKISGKAIGVDNDCNLLLRTKDNKLIKIIEGDIKVRYQRQTRNL